MSEPSDLVSRRQLFTSWFQGLANGLTEWALSRPGEGFLEEFREDSEPEPRDDHVHPWRDLLTPGPEEPENGSAEHHPL